MENLPQNAVDAFEQIALAKQAEGFKFYSAQDIVEEISWKLKISCGCTQGDAVRALSRWFMEKHKCPGFFKTRNLTKGSDKKKYRDISIVPVKVRDRFEERALEILLTGAKQTGGMYILQKMRWYDKDIHNQPYKINDIWAPSLVRWFMEKYNCPGFFRTVER